MGAREEGVSNLHDAPSVTIVEEPTIERQSPRCLTLERLALRDKDINKEMEEQGSRAQKKIRQNNSSSMPVEVSSKGSLSHRTKGPSLARITRQVGEGSSHIMALRVNTTDLLRISICSKSVGDSSKAFASFAKTITSKLDLSEFQNSRENKSIISSFKYFLKVTN